MNRCVLPFVGQPIHTSLMGKIPYIILTYRLKFHVRHKKGVSAPSSILLMILNQILLFEMHQHIGEICTKILVYDKGWVVKHIKAPARVKTEHSNL